MATKNTYLRRKSIIEKLIREKYVDVNSLAIEHNVSLVTIRNDFDNMMKRGLLVRTHGGAILPEDKSIERKFNNTIKENTDIKEIIAEKAANLVSDGDTIIIDAGSTTAILAKKLINKKITVISNSIPAIMELKNSSDIDVIGMGGILRKSSLSFIGDFSTDLLTSLNVNIYFMGATCFHPQKGITTSNIMEGKTKQSMIKVADKVCLCADNTKCYKMSLFSVCSWSNIDYLSTDTLSEADRQIIESHNVKIL